MGNVRVWLAACAASLLMSASGALASGGDGNPAMDLLEVWTDGEGQQFLVAFVAVRATSSITIDRDRAVLLGRARIAQQLHKGLISNTWRAGEWRGDDPSGRGRLHAVAVAWSAEAKLRTSWLTNTLAQSQQWFDRLSSGSATAPVDGAGRRR